MNAVTKPNTDTYAAEIPGASWQKVLIGIAAAAVVGFLVNLIFAGAAASSFNQAIDQLRAQGQEDQVRVLESFRGFAGGGGVAGAFMGLIITFITFFIGAGALYLSARILGGQGGDFMVHSYLLSLTYAPLKVIVALLNIIPIAGSCIGFLLTLYMLYSQGLSMAVSQRMERSRAIMAAFLPLVIFILLLCVGIFACAGILAAALGNAGTNP